MKDCYTIALDETESFRDAGWRVFVGHNRIKISDGGVVLSVAPGDSDPILRVRTEDGGYSVIPHNLSTGTWTPREKMMLAWAKALEFKQHVPSAPDRAKIKKDLCQPYGFIDLEMVSDDGWYEMHKTIRKCKVSDILAIGDDLKLVPAEQPGHEPWFLISAVSEQGKQFKILSDGHKFYPVTKANRVTENLGELPDEMTSLDCQMIRRAIEEFNSSLT